jgi:P4 family phage/plasmid primase-like protien
VKDEITHTRIPDADKSKKIYGGSYKITEDDKTEFFAAYYNAVFVNHHMEYLTEKQMEVGPLAIDIDFRYSAPERAYTPEHIVDFIELVLYELTQLFVIRSSFPIYVFEKASINVQPDIIKDGIHLIFGINMDRTCKEMLRNILLTKMNTIWDDIKKQITNTWESVLDEGVMKAITNWQLYGSRKPGYQPYQLVKIYECKKDNDDDYELIYTDGKLFDLKNKLPMLSVQYTGHETVTIITSLQEEYDRVKNKAPLNKKKIKVTNSISDEEFSPRDIKNTTMLTKALNRLFGRDEKSETPNDYRLKEIHDYVMTLPAPYYGANSFDKWIRVGWALKNTDFRLFVTWVAFSTQSSSFSFDQVPGYFGQWCSWPSKNNEGLTSRSIMYWSRKESPDQYERIKTESIDFYIEETIRCPTEYDIANVLYQYYKDMYVCVSIKNKTWFEYANQRWIETDSGTTIRNNLSSIKGIYGLYSKKLRSVQQEHVALEQQGNDPERHSILEKKMSRVSELCLNLKKTVFKNNIMREACDLFYIKDFMSLLDSKNHILCFNNGVIDFKERVFRNGLPEDYTSKSTNITYIKHDEAKDSATIAEINLFMEQLFPVKELRDYMWDHAASVLLGKNNNQTFNIYTGGGRNGKSKFVELMSNILGDYKGTVPVTLITQKRNSIGGTSSEIVQLMGTRYAVMQEPSMGDQINEGIMKELTGGDPIQGRALFKDTVTFIPQFKLVVCTNNLFDIKSNDDGTWRRIRVCDFQSVFTENPVEGDPYKPYQFLVDKNIDSKFEVWKTVFMSMLVERAYITQGDVVDCKMVMSKSDVYRQDQDHFADFVKNNIKKEVDGVVKESEVYETFKQWWSVQHGRSIPKGKELFDYISKRFGHKVQTKKGAMVWKGISVVYADDCEQLNEL